MRRFLSIFICLFGITFLHAQTAKTDTTVAASTLKSSADKMASLFIKKDYLNYVNYIHPKILKMVGGKDKMITVIKGSLKQTEDQGLTVTGVTIGNPAAIIISNTELQSVVPQMLHLKTAKGKLVAISYLIATSANKGKTWYFIDVSNKTLQQMKTMFPNLSNKLVIPEKKAPVFYNN
ncbi:MAG: hypothetical protein M3R50_00305 [Bacteroidota bacterium]|nr:hypothetical protein [Bacteroidota bacterium]